MTDAETSAAVEALAHRLRQRDVAMRDGEDYADAEVFALEIVTMMLGHGWRPIGALAAPKPAPASPAHPGGSDREELLGPVRAQLAAINAEKRGVGEAWRDGAA